MYFEAYIRILPIDSYCSTSNQHNVIWRQRVCVWRK